MRRPLIVGQAPGPNTDPARPLSGRCGRRLAELCGLGPDDFALLFERVNVISDFPGKAGKGDLFPLREAQEIAGGMMMNGDLSDRPVVLLGDHVARAFFLPRALKPFVWIPGLAFRIAICPHPSGVNRWWNEEANVRRARRFWRRLAREATPGP